MDFTKFSENMSLISFGSEKTTTMRAQVQQIVVVIPSCSLLGVTCSKQSLHNSVEFRQTLFYKVLHGIVVVVCHNFHDVSSGLLVLDGPFQDFGPKRCGRSW